MQLEIAEIEQELEGHLHRRQLLDKATTLLEETRATFARDHQPAVLREASRWLARLTEGHYTGVTTSIHEARLEVHDAENKAWNPDRLSRGTREQVFLSLRLALVRDLERHGVHLPVIIDDALVNFDDSRALAAARVLVEFVSDQPQERQMLVLTCHAHVAKIFADVQANVRSLSDPSANWLPQSKPQRTVRIAPAAERLPEVPTATATGEPLWEAEEFFFGGYASDKSAPDRNAPSARGSSAVRPPQGRRRRGPKRT